jgi:hypothetical protein
VWLPCISGRCRPEAAPKEHSRRQAVEDDTRGRVYLSRPRESESKTRARGGDDQLFVIGGEYRRPSEISTSITCVGSGDRRQIQDNIDDLQEDARWLSWPGRWTALA